MTRHDTLASAFASPRAIRRIESLATRLAHPVARKIALALCVVASPCRGADALVAAAPTPSFGDTWTYRAVDLFTGLESRRYALRFLRRDAIELKFSLTEQKGGPARVVDRSHDLAICATSVDLPQRTCGGPFAFPLKVGARHSYERLPNPDGYTGAQCEVEGHERLTVPAGTFDTLRVACSGRWTFTGSRDAIFQGRQTGTHWYAPAVNAEVKSVVRRYASKGGMDTQTQTELLSFAPGTEEAGAREDDLASVDSEAMREAMPPEFVAGTARFAGRFLRTAGAAGYSGEGRVAWANGDVYEGRLVRGARDGAGTFTWSNGQRYQGAWVQDRPQGKGSLRFVNGDAYEGDDEAGVPQGDGTMAYGSGDRYEGRLAEGVPHGLGSYVWGNGQALRGTWVRGKAEGAAVLVLANGDRYQGELASGAPAGPGRIEYKSGDVYVGTFRSGGADGEGIYTWRDGGRYEGQWKAGLKHGRGTVTWANGDRWQGTFDNDRQGEGTMTRKPE